MPKHDDYRRAFRRLKTDALITRCRYLDVAVEPAALCHAAIDALLDAAFGASDSGRQRQLVEEARHLAGRIARHAAHQPPVARPRPEAALSPEGVRR